MASKTNRIMKTVIIDRVLSKKEFLDNPPVLIDIGASGGLSRDWKQIAKYSICIAFEPDDREMGYIKSTSSTYKKLYVYNRLVVDDFKPESDFYLTKFAFCSSILKPDSQKLKDWAFSDLFEVEEKKVFKAISLRFVLSELKIDKVDWFKTDSQGLDLRLFLSLGEDLIEKVLVAEFEPGIIDAYVGEDKLWSIISYMEKKDFWMSSMKVQGSQRIAASIVDKMPWIIRRNIHRLIKDSPGWAEISYINSFKREFSKRDLLLGCIFALVKRQYGFAYELAIEGDKKFGDSIFIEIQKYAVLMIKYSFIKLPEYFLKKLFTN